MRSSCVWTRSVAPFMAAFLPEVEQVLADFEIGQIFGISGVQAGVWLPAADWRNRVGVMPIRALNARLKGPMEP